MDITEANRDSLPHSNKLDLLPRFAQKQAIPTKLLGWPRLSPSTLGRNPGLFNQIRFLISSLAEANGIYGEEPYEPL
jgi:hypothetical protein